jgi:hypothetical protein
MKLIDATWVKSGFAKTLFCVIQSIFFLCVASSAMAGQTFLYQSESTKQYLAGAGADYSRFIEPWKSFGVRQKISLSEVSLSDLNKLKKTDVLVMPSVVVLSQNEQLALDKFTKSGGAILASWATGGRDGAGQWQGYGWLKKMIGIDVVADIREASEERYLIPFGEALASSQLAAGRRMYLHKTSEPLLRATARYPIARFADWSRQSHTLNANTAAVAVDEINGSRRAWIGAPETTWSSTQVNMDKFLVDLLSWLHRKPKAMLAAWPAPYQAALVVEMDTEDKFENAATLEKLFSDRGIRGTFYMLTSLAVKNKDLVRRIAGKHEIGFHADVHEGFKGQASTVQDARIVKMISELAATVGENVKPSGFRAPLESYDGNTEILLRQRGLRHHLADLSSTDDALPFFSKAEPGLTPEQALVVIPRTLLDDINYAQMGLLAPGSVSAVLQENLRDKLASRALGVLSVHTQNFAPGGILEKEVPLLLDEGLKRKDVLWMPSADQVERWWRVRERLQMETVVLPNGDLQITAINAGPNELANAQVVVVTPNIKSTPRLMPGSAVGKLSRQDDFRWALALPSMPSKTQGQWIVRF